MIFFESQKVYDYGEMFVEQGVPEGYYEIELGEPSVKRAGTDLTSDHARARALHGGRRRRRAEAKHGVSAEVIDLRAAVPLNYAPLVESVRKTGQGAAGSATRSSAAA